MEVVNLKNYQSLEEFYKNNFNIKELYTLLKYYEFNYTQELYNLRSELYYEHNFIDYITYYFNSMVKCIYYLLKKVNSSITIEDIYIIRSYKDLKKKLWR